MRLLPSAEPAVDPVARPAQDRPGPVLLVPGYGGSRGGLQRLAARIEATGRSATVLTLVGDGTGDLSAQVALLDAAVDAALAAGAPSVDVVGYSAGGVVAGLWVARDDGATKARRVVTLGSPAGRDVPRGDRVGGRPRRLPGGLPPARAGQRRDHGAGPQPGRCGACRGCRCGRPTTTRSPRRRRRRSSAGTVQLQIQAVCPGARVTHSALPTDPAVTGLVLRALSRRPSGRRSDWRRLRRAARRRLTSQRS